MFFRTGLLLLSSLVTGSVQTSQQYEWDEQGYVLYCPCMGKHSCHCIYTHLRVVAVHLPSLQDEHRNWPSRCVSIVMHTCLAIGLFSCVQQTIQVNQK